MRSCLICRTGPAEWRDACRPCYHRAWRLGRLDLLGPSQRTVNCGAAILAALAGGPQSIAALQAACAAWMPGTVVVELSRLASAGRVRRVERGVWESV